MSLSQLWEYISIYLIESEASLNRKWRPLFCIIFLDASVWVKGERDIKNVLKYLGIRYFCVNSHCNEAIRTASLGSHLILVLVKEEFDAQRWKEACWGTKWISGRCWSLNLDLSTSEAWLLYLMVSAMLASLLPGAFFCSSSGKGPLAEAFHFCWDDLIGFSQLLPIFLLCRQLHPVLWWGPKDNGKKKDWVVGKGPRTNNGFSFHGSQAARSSN